jgi:aspartate kinase
VEIAMKYNVPVHVRSTFTDEEGTWVTGADPTLEARVLTGIACAKGQVQVVLAGVPARPDMIAEVTALLADLNVCADMLGHTVTTEGWCADISFALAETDLFRVRPPLLRLVATAGTGEVRTSGRLAKVSLIGIGVRSDPRIAAHLCHSLLRHDIAVRGLVASELRISCLVDDDQADSAARILHDAFGLSQDAAAPVLS